MITTLIVRVCEILFTAVALGLSIKAVRWQVYGHTPATSSYSAFAGAFGLFVAFIGVVAMWIEKIPGLIMSIIDALASVILLAAGIAFAVGLRGVNCSKNDSRSNTANAALLNGGCNNKKGDDYYCGYASPAELSGRCHLAEADAAFLLLGFLTCAAASVLCFIAHRRSGSAKHSAV